MGSGISPIDFADAPARPRPLDVRWIHGSPSAKHNTDPDIQVHAYDEHTFILRQNMAIDYEAPFLFLLMGNTRAVLIDTGATASPRFLPLRRVVDELVRSWLARHPRADYQLLVLHSHPHGDHVAGDGQFADRPDTTVVGAERAAAWPYFGFDDRPESVAQVDLGGRVLECLATPGHHDASVTFYDRWTGILLTGDTVYPGRLYIQDWQAFRRTIDRLIDFCDERTITHILGCHIEMTRRPGVGYPVRTVYQPEEPPLQMTTSHLHEIRAALDEIGDQPARRAFPLFILCPT
ncbi:MBL fold metallo-hydrolase [Streptomyces sp. NPDC006460]|uniref:MBL fold metallo-hydrolase n=1 Tax=Streptomyces sp. NPDC006460 TaxID=3154304 RepID=UPI0033BC485F